MNQQNLVDNLPRLCEENQIKLVTLPMSKGVSLVMTD
jgi:hypothetical protein